MIDWNSKKFAKSSIPVSLQKKMKMEDEDEDEADSDDDDFDDRMSDNDSNADDSEDEDQELRRWKKFAEEAESFGFTEAAEKAKKTIATMRPGRKTAEKIMGAAEKAKEGMAGKVAMLKVHEQKEKQLLVFCFDVKIIANYFLIIYLLILWEYLH